MTLLALIAVMKVRAFGTARGFCVDVITCSLVPESTKRKSYYCSAFSLSLSLSLFFSSLLPSQSLVNYVNLTSNYFSTVYPSREATICHYDRASQITRNKKSSTVNLPCISLSQFLLLYGFVLSVFNGHVGAYINPLSLISLLLQCNKVKLPFKTYWTQWIKIMKHVIQKKKVWIYYKIVGVHLRIQENRWM
jgi:hypothetical protein